LNRERKIAEVAEAVCEGCGTCVASCPKEAEYVITVREGYTAPHLGAEMLHVFEGQLGIRTGTLEQQFKRMFGHYGVAPE
jgi:ferredoxin